MDNFAAVVDIDGTLVDSSYQHVLAWSRAFRRHGITVHLATIHAHMGMGGDRLVTEVAGQDVEDRLGDPLRESWKTEYDELLDEVSPLEDAAELLATLADRGLRVVLATSGKPSHTRRALELLGLSEGTYALATSEDTDVTKPSPDIIEVALSKAGVTKGFAIGDTAWDVKAARAAGLPTVALLTGGIAEHTLREAGAAAVEPSPHELLKHLDDVLHAIR